MMIWSHSSRDVLLATCSAAQLAATTWLAVTWDDASLLRNIAAAGAMTLMVTYNIVVVSHLFTHAGWFASRRLDSAASMLNSINAAQSVQEYALSHVRNHHRYNNDRAARDGSTHDTSSTFRGSSDGDHIGLARYALGGAVSSFVSQMRTLLAVSRMWRVGPGERAVLELAASAPDRRAGELRQARLDRIAIVASIAVYGALSWRFALQCYAPSVFVAFALVNVQNYYEHYGADPDNRRADSVSYYGRAYNLLSFNDGYHQEHHLHPGAHWTRMPRLRKELDASARAVRRVVSSAPAIVGFLDRRRPQLHRMSQPLSLEAGPRGLESQP